MPNLSPSGTQQDQSSKKGTGNKEGQSGNGNTTLTFLHLQPDRSNRDNNDLMSDMIWLTTAEDSSKRDALESGFINNRFKQPARSTTSTKTTTTTQPTTHDQTTSQKTNTTLKTRARRRRTLLVFFHIIGSSTSIVFFQHKGKTTSFQQARELSRNISNDYFYTERVSSFHQPGRSHGPRSLALPSTTKTVGPSLSPIGTGPYQLLETRKTGQKMGSRPQHLRTQTTYTRSSNSF